MWARLYFVARRLVSAHHVRSLGLQLGVADYTIDTALYNHRYDIQEAGYTVLKAFIQGQESRTKAYARLQGALTHSSVGLDQMTGRVLNSPVTDVIQDFECLWKACKEHHTKAQTTPEEIVLRWLREKEDAVLAAADRMVINMLMGIVKTKSPQSIVNLFPYDPVLHDSVVKVLSMKLNEEDIYRLASRLDISLKDIEFSFARFCTNKKAAIYDILDTWFKRHSSRREAYVKLAKALIHPDVGLNLVAREVLRYPLAEPDSLVTNCPKLKDRHLRKVSRRISKEKMYLLGQKLGISSRQMDASFMKFCTSEKDAILYILSRWLNRQNSREEAYLILGDAMIHKYVGLNLIAKEVLGYSK